jgi:hypothetical protein
MAKTKKQATTRKATVRRKPTKTGSRKRAAQTPTTSPARQQTKKDVVLALLRREEGATLAELMTATGWQAHSVRGFISGTLRKKLGLAVSAGKNAAGEHSYQIKS